MAGEERLSLVAPDPRIDDIGARVFGDEDYRPGVPSRLYFRKFNAFLGHREPFLFLDVNTVMLSTFDPGWYFPKLGPVAVYFRGPSKPGRTVRKGVASEFLHQLGLRSPTGYNMGGFVSRGGVLDVESARALAGRHLRPLLGKAPEQGFMAFYLAIHGVDNGLMVELESGIQLLHRGEAISYGDGTTRRADPPHRIVALTKFTGPDYTPHSGIIERIIKTRLSEVAS